jgi:hypothetical protein
MKSPHYLRLEEAAQKLGITTEDLSALWETEAAAYRMDEHVEIILEGCALGSNSYLGTSICDDLFISRQQLASLGIPIPKGKLFKLAEASTSRAELQRLLGDFWKEGKTYACHPAFSAEGRGHLPSVRELEDLEIHLDTYAEDYATWILDEQTEGEDLDLLIIGGQLVAGILPAALYLTGNGQQSLEELMEAHNEGVPEERQIIVDAEMRQLLRDQNVFLSEIIPAGKAIKMKNPSTDAGGASEASSSLLSDYSEWCSKIGEATSLRMLSLRLRVHSQPGLPSQGAVAMSMNHKPNWLAFEYAANGRLDIATLILREVFKGHLK